MKRTLLALTGVALLMAGCSSNEAETPEMIDARVTIAGAALRIDQGANRCSFVDGDLTNGSPALLRGADDRILAKTELRVQRIAPDAETPTVGTCEFLASFDDVEANEPTYQVVVADFEPEIIDGAEITRRPMVTLRSVLDVAGR